MGIGPTFLCFLLNMIIKKRADNIRPYDFLMGAQKRRKPFWGEETLRNARGVDFVRNPPQQYGVHVDEVGAAICRPNVIET